VSISAPSAAPTPPIAGAPVTLAAALLRTARPRQWIKNGAVLAAPAAAGVLGTGATAGRLACAFGCLCAVASGTYLLNDAADAERDRRHPVKRLRPVAAGDLPRAVAVLAGTGLMAAGLLASWLTIGAAFLATVAGYVVLTVAYTLWLKHVPVIELATVAAAYILRAAAGGVAAGVPLSRWFLIVVSFGALFLVAGKRYSEYVTLGDHRGHTRETLDSYTASYLRFVWSMAATVSVAAYCLWAFREPAQMAAPWPTLTIVPFVLGVLRYALILDSGGGAAPEELILGDRTLKLIVGAWIALFAAGLILGS